MKCFNNMFFLVAILTSTLAFGAEHVKVTIYGGQAACDYWNEETDSEFSRNMKKGYNSSWLAGYMSAMNISEGKDTFKKISVVTASDFVTRYCKDNPSKDATDAVKELVKKLDKLR
ncbi:hypothetical protein [Erwinia aphidicola]|uniref:hypothetical protein n=1 Tax=Erwinia aphidicola TaxID=68334 RepID=UPI003019FD92